MLVRLQQLIIKTQVDPLRVQSLAAVVEKAAIRMNDRDSLGITEKILLVKTLKIIEESQLSNIDWGRVEKSFSNARNVIFNPEKDTREKTFPLFQSYMVTSARTTENIQAVTT